MEEQSNPHPNTIYFYGMPTQKALEEHTWLGNFYPAAFQIHGLVYPTVEHYYQSQKFSDPEIQERIRTAATPKQAYRITHKVGYDSSEWQAIKDSVMRFGIFAKFTQNLDLKEKLLSTEDAKLIEDSPKDPYWGGSLENSRNRLGELLMELRENLRQASEN